MSKCLSAYLSFSLLRSALYLCLTVCHSLRPRQVSILALLLAVSHCNPSLHFSRSFSPYVRFPLSYTFFASKPLHLLLSLSPYLSASPSAIRYLPPNPSFSYSYCLPISLPPPLSYTFFAPNPPPPSLTFTASLYLAPLPPHPYLSVTYNHSAFSNQQIR